MDSKVDAFLESSDKWQEELKQLRRIILDCMLTEELKWGVPCYTYHTKNIVVIGGLKESCVLSFFKGALLIDDRGILTKPGDNTQVVRIIRFTSVQEIKELEPTLKSYIYEAIEVEKAGVKIKPGKDKGFKIAKEFQKRLDKNPALKEAFIVLTPGRQRAYNLYFSQAKQSKTCEARIDKCIRKILDGKGLNE
jgi:uncharacterized protein YdeI (YjbR/CyaY-like superfamily)